jgi:hypothetical protein
MNKFIFISRFTFNWGDCVSCSYEETQLNNCPNTHNIIADTENNHDHLKKELTKKDIKRKPLYVLYHI